MSQYPCDVHGRRYPGAQESAYLALLRGNDKLSRRLRLCPADMDHLLTDVGARWVSADDDETAAEIAVCSACGGDVGEAAETFALFATVYRRGADRVDYYGVYHRGGCTDQLVNTYYLKPN